MDEKGSLLVNNYSDIKIEFQDKFIKANKKQRLLNLIVDSSILQVLSYVINTIFFNDLYSASILCFLSYYIIFEYFLRGKTFGKLLTKTKVVSVYGFPPTFNQVLRRTCCRFLPYEILSIFFKKNNNTWHDGASYTMIIKNNIF